MDQYEYPVIHEGLCMADSLSDAIVYMLIQNIIFVDGKITTATNHSWCKGKTAMVKISVVTVCFNAQDTIRQTIESVIAQEDCHMEYLIQDGDSRDETIKYYC